MAYPPICLQIAVSARPVFKYSILHRPCYSQSQVAALALAAAVDKKPSYRYDTQLSSPR